MLLLYCPITVPLLRGYSFGIPFFLSVVVHIIILKSPNLPPGILNKVSSLHAEKWADVANNYSVILVVGERKLGVAHSVKREKEIIACQAPPIMVISPTIMYR